jgi:hypothetical protein
MTRFGKAVLGGVAAIGLGMSSAQAALSVSGLVGGAPTGTIRFNFDDLPLGTAGGASTAVNSTDQIIVNITTNGQAVQGSASGVYAAPFLSGGNGTGFGPGGSNEADGVNATTDLTSGSTGSVAAAQVELVLPFTATYFGILWGSVDSYNTLFFYDGATLVGSVTGSAVTASPNGNQGVNGTLYVNIESTLGFNRVVARSSSFAFEFDNVALSAAPIPAPASLALLGLGLLGLGAARRGRRARA